MELLAIGFILWLLCGIIGAAITSNKGRGSCSGFALGFLLGPIGLIIALVLAPVSTDNPS